MLQGLALLTLLPWWLMAIFAPMLSAGGATPVVYALVYGIWSYPVLLLALGAASWVCFRQGRHRAALWLSALMLVPALLVALGSLLPG